MTLNRLQIAGLTVGALAIGAGGIAIGYRLHSSTSFGETKAPRAAIAPPSPPRTPLYYQDPDGKPDYSPAPKKTPDGRDYKPVYDDAGAKPGQPAATAAPAGSKRILYYRNPMGLPDTSPVPKKDSMRMDYIPVYEGDDQAGVVTVSPARMQMLGVRTAPVEMLNSLAGTVHATGTIQADESRYALVTTRFDVVVQKLFVSTTGAAVHAGQPLAQVWIDTPDTSMQRGPDVVSREINYIVALQDKDPVQIALTEDVLRQYGIPDAAIAEIRRTGRASRQITLLAPRSGVVLEKPAIEGMRINTGDPLFKIADLSQVWLQADVQEQDLGKVKVGETAHATLVAYPGQSFIGKVDFIYPTLMAATRTGRVRIVLPNPNGALREAMYANVALDTPAAPGNRIVIVPDSAVIDSGTRQVVLVAKGQGRFEPRAVHLGTHGDGVTQILDGVKPGENVVVSANFLIDAESNLRAALATFNGGEK
jgi:Cu(I)/Ag(I) efflux system membrane fusion protein